MKKSFILILALLITFVSNAQLLWKIAGNGLSRPSYLFGTHHVAPAVMIDSVPGLINAINEVDVICGEIQKDEMLDPEIAQKVMTMGIAPKDSTLSKLLTPEEFHAVDSLLSSLLGMPGILKSMEAMRPAIVSTQLAICQSMIAFPGYDPNVQLDVEIMAQGERAGKKIIGFETVEEQLSFLLDQPLDEQAQDLVKAVLENDKEIQYAIKLAHAYTSQNLDEITSMIEDPEFGLDEAQRQRLLYKRNENWAEKLKLLMPENSILTSVGCGHLVGSKGMIAILRNLGFDVIPVE